MAQSWFKEETSSPHSERAGGRTQSQSQSQPQAQVQAQAQARARAHAQAQVPVQIQVQVHAQTNSDVPSSRTFANMNQAANVPSSMSRSQSTEAQAQTPTLLAPSSISPLATTTPSFSPTDSTTQPSSSLHPIAINNFNTIDIPYTESNYSSSNVSPASTSTPATPSAAADTLAASSSPSVSASAPTSSACSTKAPSVSTSSDARAPTATSASSQVKAKRVRTSKPKVKTGCTNCKQRRIKCDEARPACTQCVRSNKNCTGYPPPSRSSRPFEEIRIAPKPMPVYDAHASSSAPIAPLQGDYHLLPRRVHQRAVLRAASPGTPSPSPTTYQPSVALQIQPNETFYFDVFRSHTAHELSGFFNNLFWTHYVLQECHSEDAIKCAVIALGALYQTLEQTAALNLRSGHDAGSDARVEVVRSHWQVAIRRYGDACNALVKLNTQDQRSHRTSIMANVLLACFDSFIGDHRQAIHQIQTGLGLLDIFRTQQRQRLLPASEHSLEEELVTIFTRLAIQAKSYDMAFHFPQPFSIRLSSQSQTQSPGHSGTNTPLQEEPISIPENFTSVIEARVACDTLNARIMRYIEELFSMKTDLRGTLPPSWLDYGLSFKNHLDAWAKAFDNLFFTRHNPSVSLQEKAGIAALKMLATNSRILYLMMFSDKESDFDNFLPQFQTIVDLGIEIVGDEERRAAARDCPNPGQCQHRQRETWQPQDFFPAMGFSAPHIKPRFAADLGIVAPLFVVATKCRDPGTRRRAIQLLRSSARREGMWDSEMVANISAWVMNLEESEALAMGVESYPADGISRPIPRIIPEGKRFTIRSVDFDLRTRVADLHVGTRGLPPGVPDPKFRQTRLNW